MLVLFSSPTAAQEELALDSGTGLSTGEKDLHVTYTIDLRGAATHVIEVSLEISGLDQPDLQLVMPSAPDPRSLDRRARHISVLTATGPEGFDLPVYQRALGEWECDTRGIAGVTVQYTCYANDPSPWSAQLTARHAYVNPAAVLLYAPLLADRQLSINLLLPNGWQAAVALEPSFDPTRFRSNSFAQLASSPIMAGRFQDAFFAIDDMNVRVVIDGATSTFDDRTFLLGLERLVRRSVALFETMPTEDYLFILHFADARVRTGAGFCTTTTVFWDQHAREEDQNPLLSVCTGSFLRSWLGGRIRPQTIRDPLREPLVVESLWFLEGAAAYYADLLLTRSGFVPGEDFLGKVSMQITALQNTPARLLQSARSASEQVRYRTWPEYRRPDRSLDPRTKGYVLCFLLDLAMRDASDNHRSLDDLMGFMTAWFGRGGRPYADSEEIIRAAGALAGTDLSDFYTRFVAGTDELPYEELATAAGWDLRREAVQIATAGFDTEPEGSQTLIVTAVEEHAPAARAGLRVGDRIVQANGRPASPALPDILTTARPGEQLTLTIQRRMTEETISFELGQGNRQGYVLEALAEADARQQAIATGLLSGIP